MKLIVRVLSSLCGVGAVTGVASADAPVTQVAPCPPVVVSSPCPSVMMSQTQTVCVPVTRRKGIFGLRSETTMELRSAPSVVSGQSIIELLRDEVAGLREELSGKQTAAKAEKDKQELKDEIKKLGEKIPKPKD